jgi:hypothetical protein
MNRYTDIKLKKTSEGIRYRRNLIFPEIPESLNDLYLITTAGDRFDTLALTYYKDSSLWWIIAGVNNSKKDSLVVQPGVQLRIPMNIQSVLDAFNTVNNDR